MGNQTLDRIKISGITALCTLGTQDWERLVKTEIVIDLSIYFDQRKSANTDNLENTVDYAAVTEAVSQYVNESSFKLAESLAEGVANICLGIDKIEKVEVELEKRSPLANGIRVAVEISRSGS